jgi:hypothetical protein
MRRRTWRRARVIPAALALVVLAAACIDNTTRTLDVHGDPVDAHDGDYFVAEGSYWSVGTAYGCGFTLNVSGPYCGVRVYRSPDLATWTPAGAVRGTHAFDETGADWQAMCSVPAFGCFRPHVERRTTDGRYVMWLNTHGGEGTAQAGYVVLVADTPGGPYQPLPQRPRLAVDPGGPGLQHGDHDLVMAPDGRAYVAYTVIDETASPSHRLVVEELSRDLTTGTGRHAVVPAVNDLVGGGPVEAPALFRSPHGTWHLAFSAPARPYAVVATGIVDAFEPLGPWTDPRQLNADSCAGQPAGVRTLGRDVVYWTDRWVQTDPPGGVVGNQYEARTYLAPLSFGATDPVTGTPAIDAHTCVDRWSPQPLP